MLPSLLTAVFFSISVFCANRTARHLGGTRANLGRLLIGTVLIGLLAFLFGKGIQGPALSLFILSGLVGYGLGDFGLFQSYPRLGARLSAVLVQCTAVPFGILIEWLWLGTKLTPSQMLSSSVILTGIALALFPEKQNPIPLPKLLSGILFGLLAGFGQALGAVISRKGYAVCAAINFDMDGITAGFQRIIGGLVLTLIFHLIARRFHPIPKARVPGKIWLLMVANAIAGPVLGMICYLWALKTTPTGIVLSIVALTPLFVIPQAWFFDGERPSARSVLGSLLAIAGVFGLLKP